MGLKMICNAARIAGVPLSFFLLSAIQVVLHYYLDDEVKRSARIHPHASPHYGGAPSRLLSYISYMFVHSSDKHLWNNMCAQLLAVWTVSFHRSSKEANLTILAVYLSSGAVAGMVASMVVPTAFRRGCSSAVNGLFGLCFVDAGVLGLKYIWRATSCSQLPKASWRGRYLVLLLVSIADTAAETIDDLNECRVGHLTGLVFGIIFGFSIKLISWPFRRDRQQVAACPVLPTSIKHD